MAGLFAEFLELLAVHLHVLSGLRVLELGGEDGRWEPRLAVGFVRRLLPLPAIPPAEEHPVDGVHLVGAGVSHVEDADGGVHRANAGEFLLLHLLAVGIDLRRLLAVRENLIHQLLAEAVGTLAEAAVGLAERLLDEVGNRHRDPADEELVHLPLVRLLHVVRCHRVGDEVGHVAESAHERLLLGLCHQPAEGVGGDVAGVAAVLADPLDRAERVDGG